MAQDITFAGEKLFATQAQLNQALDIDTFIFANVPGQDSTAAIDRNEGLPPVAQRVHTQAVQQKGKINDNIVVYSTVLESITGPFEFNWVGLYSSVHQTLIAVQHIPTVNKTTTVGGAAGNTLNRNFGIEYSGIAALTEITVDAQTWQLDFSARLSGMDELTRQLASDMNGKDWFIDDGFKVVPRSTANTFSVTPGVGYVSGLRVELKQEHILTLQTYPQFVYVDAYFDGNASSQWKPQVAFTVSNTEMDDYIDVNGVQHYVFKIAEISGNNLVEDLRNNDGLSNKIASVKDAQYKRQGSKKTKVFEPEAAQFAFHFDGPYVSNLTTLLDKADELGVPVCIGSINNLTNCALGGQNENPKYGYVSQLIDAHRRGHEIYNHGFSSDINLKPGTNVTANRLNFWVNYSHEWLQSLGINSQIWVTSNGGGVTNQSPHLDPKYIPKILERHSVVFGRTSSPWKDIDGFRGASFGADTPVNKEGLTRANIEGVTQQKIEEFVDYCIENKRVAVFHGHDSGNLGQLTVAGFEAAVNYIHSKGCRVTTSQDVFASFTNLFTDDAVTAKAANIAALESKSVIQENLLSNTNLNDWTRSANPNMGTVTFDSLADDRVNGEQFRVIVTDPAVVNVTYDITQTINRLFNVNDVASLCFAIQAATTEKDDFGIECIAQFFTGLNGSGTKINEFRRGAVIEGDTPFQMVFADGANFFTYSNIQSVKLIYQIANKTIWTGSKELHLFNPRFNRGNSPADFFKKKVLSKTEKVSWKGNMGEIGTISLSNPVSDARFIKIEVGVNNSDNDVRGSVLVGYNTYDRTKIRAWSGELIYTDFVVKFNSPTELEIISEEVVGAGDFAVIGVYKY